MSGYLKLLAGVGIGMVAIECSAYLNGPRFSETIRSYQK